MPQVRPSFFTREEFKTAANAITQTGYTPEHRSNVEDLLGVSVVCLPRLYWIYPTCDTAAMSRMCRVHARV